MSDPSFGEVDVSDARWAEYRRSAPMTLAINHSIAAAHFEQRFERRPLPPHDPRASVNDLIFARMIDPKWSPLHRAFVDKETAKSEARRLVPDVLMPDTLSVVAVDAVRSVEHLYHLLQPYIGQDAIAKPAHASGAVTFMRDVTSPKNLRFLYDLALLDYAFIMREMQYWQLPRKVIVESMVPVAGGVTSDDYKFHCVHGEPLVCQVDHNRFRRPWSRLLRLPDFAPMDPDDGLERPDSCTFPAPDRIAAMIKTARALATPFDFVRVDLYNGDDGVYFGELTFTPSASLGVAPSGAGDHFENETHRRYSRIIMNAVRRG